MVNIIGFLGEERKSILKETYPQKGVPIEILCVRKKFEYPSCENTISFIVKIEKNN